MVAPSLSQGLGRCSVHDAVADELRVPQGGDHAKHRRLPQSFKLRELRSPRLTGCAPVLCAQLPPLGTVARGCRPTGFMGTKRMASCPRGGQHLDGHAALVDFWGPGRQSCGPGPAPLFTSSSAAYDVLTSSWGS